jgi:hypothetical protein
MKGSRTKTEVADLIERFLRNHSRYPQEWNDFIECSDPDAIIDAYRRKSCDLDPLVNRPEPVDEDAVFKLRGVVEELRKE